jgi:methylmalonyl-CoA/ethylmalonyl-CoA epimerase
MGIAEIGPVMQIAFVPRDFDAAIRYWTQTMGVGPFYLMENIQLGEGRYRGEPSDFTFSIALAYWGDMQIELIRPENDAPNMYQEHADDTMHHTCILTDDIVKARRIAEGAGAKVIVEGKVAPDGAVIYVDSGNGPGSIVEILQMSTGGDGLFAMIKSASVNWDGKDPVRKLG